MPWGSGMITRVGIAGAIPARITLEESPPKTTCVRQRRHQCSLQVRTVGPGLLQMPSQVSVKARQATL